jgi:hypothetical protein
MNEETNTSRKAVRGRTKRTIIGVIALFLALVISTTSLAAKGNNSVTASAGTDAQSGATAQPPAGGNGGGNGGGTGGGSQNSNRNKAKISAPDFDKIQKAIAKLTDEALKAELTALLNAYQQAWTAKQDAVAANDTASLAALTDAITTAKSTLDAALESAGVTNGSVYGTPVEALDGPAHRNRRPVLDADQILAVIATLPDTNADKSTLTSLLNAYQVALAAQNAANFASLTTQEQEQLMYNVRLAEEALLIAAREAGLIGGNGRGQFVSGYAFGQSELDVTSILASIAALDDTDANKATLTALMEAYSTALTAEAAADKTALTQDEFEALHDATIAAEKALIDALELAGIDVPIVRDDSQPRYTAPTYVYDSDDENEYESEGDDD